MAPPVGDRLLRDRQARVRAQRAHGQSQRRPGDGLLPPSRRREGAPAWIRRSSSSRVAQPPGAHLRVAGAVRRRGEAPRLGRRAQPPGGVTSAIETGVGIGTQDDRQAFGDTRRQPASTCMATIRIVYAYGPKERRGGTRRPDRRPQEYGPWLASLLSAALTALCSCGAAAYATTSSERPARGQEPRHGSTGIFKVAHACRRGISSVASATDRRLASSR